MTKISRGHPLFALLALLLGWAGGRAATWEAPVLGGVIAPAEAQGQPVMQSMPGYWPAVEQAENTPVPSLPPSHIRTLARYMPAYPAPMPYAFASPAEYGVARSAPHLRTEFQGFESLPRFYAPEVAAASPSSGGLAAPIAPPRAKRWSIDAWALLRRDGMGGGISPGALPATYGGSQSGGILRYRLSLSDPHRPTAYLRTTAATGMIRETTAALGFSARPLRQVPIIAALEGRLTDQSGRRRMQAAAMAISELPLFPLPGGFRGEAYGQAGYVAGRFSTLFADGQFRADKGLLRVGSVETRVGGGIWGGAQKGAARLDAGPSASVTMPLGRSVYGRMAVDWRFRLAGEAVPKSGPALTLSAGF